jgi:hypothetical protein
MSTKSIHIFILSVAALTTLGCGGNQQQHAANTGDSAPTTANAVQTTNRMPTNAGADPGTISPNNNRGRREVVEHPAEGAPPPLQFQEAPEDSQIAVTMRPDGSVYEVRVFKSHPRLAKVEVVWQGIGERTLKIFSRNGNAVEKKTDRIQDLATAPTQLLLEIAGLAAPAPAGQTGEKKKPR